MGGQCVARFGVDHRHPLACVGADGGEDAAGKDSRPVTGEGQVVHGAVEVRVPARGVSTRAVDLGELVTSVGPDGVE